MKAKQKILMGRTRERETIVPNDAGGEQTPIRGRRLFLLEEEVAKLKTKVDETVAPLAKRVMSELGITTLPTPIDLKNGQVLKEPWLLLLYAEAHALKELDMAEQHGESPAILRGLRTNLTRIYSTPEHPPNAWVTSILELILSHYANILDLYVLISPTDDGGRAAPLEAAHIERLITHTRKTRELARRLVAQLDEDYTRKNAGRSAAAVVHGARHLDVRHFAPQDEWIFKKAAAKVSSRDDEGSWRDRNGGRDGSEGHGRARGSSRWSRGGGGRGRGRGRGRGARNDGDGRDQANTEAAE